MNIKKDEIRKFLNQSNYIEEEYSPEALEDAERAFRYAFKHKKR